MVGGIKEKAWSEIGMFEQTLCDVVVSPLPECILGMAMGSGRGKLQCKGEGMETSLQY